MKTNQIIAVALATAALALPTHAAVSIRINLGIPLFVPQVRTVERAPVVVVAPPVYRAPVMVSPVCAPAPVVACAPVVVLRPPAPRPVYYAAHRPMIHQAPWFEHRRGYQGWERETGEFGHGHGQGHGRR